jgi:hypothetical protein
VITQARLKELLHYDPETGVFTWLVNRGPAKRGAVAGTPSRGYLVIRVDGPLYFAHVLAWLYVTGELPAAFVDHRNEVKSDNSWDNLRAATKQQNAQNISRPNRNSSSGHRGVYLDKRRSRWFANVTDPVTRRGKFVGSFATREEAVAARVRASVEVYGAYSPVYGS